MPPPKPPMWLDTNVLVTIDQGSAPYAERELLALEKDGHKLLITPAVEREFLFGPQFRPQDTFRRIGVLKRLPIEFDPMPLRVPMQQVMDWQREGMLHGLSGEDAKIIAEIRASAQARGITNPIFLTHDGGGTLLAMRRRGVQAIKFKSAVPREIPASPPRAPSSRGIAGGVAETEAEAASKVGWKAALKAGFKAGFKAAIKDAFSASNLASMIPDVVLAIADKVAAREAIRAIEVKFIKEGFAKGVAAGAMGWTEVEVTSTLQNRITAFRVKGLEDPAGLLTHRIYCNWPRI